MKYRSVSLHPEDLADGRVIAPGEKVELSEEDLREDHNERLFAEGVLIAVNDDGEDEAKKAAQRGRRDMKTQERKLLSDPEGDPA